MADKKISELDSVIQMNNDAVLPFSQENGGEDTTFKILITALGAKIVEDLTFSNLGTTSKKIVGAINELLSMGKPIILGTTAPSSSQGENGSLYIQYTEGTGGADDVVDDIYIKIDGVWCEIATGGGGSSTLAGLSDVDITTTTPTNNQVLKYDSTKQKWVNGSALGIKSVVFDVVASHPTDPSTYSVAISVENTSVFSKGYSCSIWGEFSATTNTFVYDGVEYTVVAQGYRAVNQGATCFRLSINNVSYDVPLANRQNSSFATSDSFSLLVKTGSVTASDIFYDNSASGLQAENIQDAIDEVDNELSGKADISTTCKYIQTTITWNANTNRFDIPSQSPKPVQAQQCLIGRNSSTGSLYALWYVSTDENFALGTVLSGNAPTSGQTCYVNYVIPNT